MSTPPFLYQPCGGEAERQRLGEILAECFGFPVADTASWFDYAGHSNLRVLHREGEVIGGLVVIPMAQFWGGRSVRLLGAAGVGINPWQRGGGAATFLMAEMLREARREGYALAGLYPATQPVYRRVGFEQAGARFEHRCRLALLPAGTRELPMRPFTQADLPALQALYTERACSRHGWLDRGPYVWHRVRYPRGMQARGYVVEEQGRLAGYAFVAQTRKPDTPLGYNLVLTDLAARSPAAWQRLLSFLAGYASMADEVRWYGGAQEELLLLLREQSLTTSLYMHWMVRVVDVVAALSARGWPAGLSATLHLEVDDPLLPENSGRWVLEVSGGEGRVQRGGEGHLRCDARTLASLYSGYRSATTLASLGALQGTPSALEVADTLFAGPTPTMPDMF